MSDGRQTRRGFLRGAAGLAATATLAGCSAQATGSLDPHVPPSRLGDAWELRDEIDESATETVRIAGTTQRVQLDVRAEVYVNDTPLERLAERLDVATAETETAPAETFVAAKARVDPPITRLLGFSQALMGQAVDAAEDQAKRQLREAGFRNIRRVESGTLTVDAGPEATHRVYRADYPYEAFQVDYEGRPLTVDAGTFTVEAQLAAWPYRGLLVTGAGVYPGEPGELVVSAQGQTREIDLGFEPERYREDVRGLIKAIS